MSKTGNKKKLSPEQQKELLNTLKTRFEKNMNRHKGIEWIKVQSKLEVIRCRLQILLPAMDILLVENSWNSNPMNS